MEYRFLGPINTDHNHIDVMIRNAVPQDAEELLEYLRVVGGETDNLTFGDEGLPLTVEAERAYLEANRNNARQQIFVAMVDDQIVGNATYRSYTRERMMHQAEIAMSVRRDYWGRGIGSHLLQRMIEEMHVHGIDLVTLIVLEDNRRAIELYKRFGFSEYGELERYFKVDGVYRTAIYMKLDLQ